MAWQVQQLSRVQNLCLRLICAVFKTSPIYALEIEAAIPPISKVLDKVDRDTAARLHKLGPRSPVLQRLRDSWENHRLAGDSGSGRSTGAGFVSYHLGVELTSGCVPMGKKAEVYDAEMHAMSSAIVGLENLDNDLGTCTLLYFFADNSSSVEAILQEHPGPS
ncbi:hypothetical protein AURDEDRAFT_178361 [Auricularia subglabra TFB-10046 SS5]|uniref:Uncharacterized protein n=1 Tax=Auricularia subglabra (strain TFB-10046 / SS5) TaxID=717982 RepID=J0L8A5_AURST|nr:hypothetical protein AURDEDRAFT_178361 [Auricularia subglabra TFB-10046 SS5]